MDQKSLKILIAIPFYHQAHYLKEAMQSVLTQTDASWDLLILDDSLDPKETEMANKICLEFNDPRIHYERNPQNLGMAKNWNQGLDRGNDYLGVMILHGDDRLLPNYLTQVRSALLNSPEVTAFFCKTEIIGAGGEICFSFPDWYKDRLIPHLEAFELKGEAGIQALLKGNFIFCPTLCFNPKKLAALRFDPRYKMVLDLDLIFKILKTGGSLLGLYQTPLYQYRRHAQNATSTMTANLIRFEEEEALLRPHLKGGRRPLIVILHLCYLSLRSFFTLNFSLGFRFLNRMIFGMKKPS